MTASVTNVLSLLTIAMQAGIVLVTLLRITTGKFPAFIANNALFFAWTIALVATLGSLFFSEYAGYEPCKLCWFQRILMYPLVLVLGVPLFKRERSFPLSAVLLAIIGLVIAGYHYLMQLGVAPELPCSAVGFSVSCSERFVMNYGYVTIPLMSGTAFAAVLGLAWAGKKG